MHATPSGKLAMGIRKTPLTSIPLFIVDRRILLDIVFLAIDKERYVARR